MPSKKMTKILHREAEKQRREFRWGCLRERFNLPEIIARAQIMMMFWVESE